MVLSHRSKKLAAAGATAKRSVFQIFSQFLLRPVECPADGAFVHTPFLSDFSNRLFLKIVSDEGMALEGCQLLLDHALDPLDLDLPGQTGAKIAFIEYIFHCGSTPCRSNGR